MPAGVPPNGENMKCENGQARLDKADLIRINQLVRPTTNYEGFRAWHQELAVSERVALLAGLCYLAYQTGVSEALHDPRVVDSILRDPDYWKTSPRDDETGV